MHRAALSYGGGQDSTALAFLYIYDADFRREYAPGEYVVAMSCTGAEHPDTAEYVQYMKGIFDKYGIEFVHITPDLGYHTGHWREGLFGQLEATSTCTSASFPNVSCTDSLKIAPWYKWYNDYTGARHGLPTADKKALKRSAQQFGKAHVQIGFAKGEESRAGIADSLQLAFELASDELAKKSSDPMWFQESIQRRFPLIELGMDRKACQDYIAKRGHPIPPPSLCIGCHWKSDELVLWTKLRHPLAFARWEAIEAAKLIRWDDEDFRRARQRRFVPDEDFLNRSVGGRFTKAGHPIVLEDRAQNARRKLAHLNDAQLLMYLDEQRFWNGNPNRSRGY